MAESEDRLEELILHITRLENRLTEIRGTLDRIADILILQTATQAGMQGDVAKCVEKNARLVAKRGLGSEDC